MTSKINKVRAPLAGAILMGLCVTAAQAAGPAALPRVKSAASLNHPSGQVGDSRTDRFIIKYRGASARTDNLGKVRGQLKQTGLRGSGNAALDVQRLHRLSTGAEVMRVSRKLDRVETGRLLAQLRSDPAVEYVQEDFLKQAYDFTPDDKYFQQLQWDFQNSNVGIHAPAAWDASTGEGIVVAVLDTGYVDHAELAANLIPGYDFIHDAAVAGDGDGRDADAHDMGDYTSSRNSSWHGTHVAGTIAAVTNNAVGVAGIAFNAKVQPVRVLGRGGGYTSDIADAITWASGGHVDGVPDNTTPAEVLNLSLGGQRRCSDDPATQDAIEGAISRGATVVVAAGNDNMDAANFSPASCAGVITVGASGVDGARSYFSNYGSTVAVSAPGGNATSGSDPENRWIWSLGNSSATDPVPSPEGDVLLAMIGTSQASPHVAATVALMQAAAVSAGKAPLTPSQIKNLLRQTATPFTVTPPANKPQGTGILNAAAAVQKATEDLPEESWTPLVNRLAATGITGAAGDSARYLIHVPAGTRSLNLRTYGGTGDVSLYVAHDRAATQGDYDRKSERAGNSETITLTNPAAGDYYLRVLGAQPFTNVSVMAVY